MLQRVENESLVSVIIPCYNCEKYIAEAIESVLNQTHKNLELVVINDGSTDGSENIILKYAQQDNRIKYYFQVNKGVSTARNQGIEKALGEIIAFLDSDDAWEPENIEIKVKTLNNHKDVDWVFSDAYFTDEDLNKAKLVEGGYDGDLLNSLLAHTGDIIHTPSNIVVRSKCFKVPSVRFDLRLSTSADLDFCIQLAANNFKGKRIPLPLISYRVRKDSMGKDIHSMEHDNFFVLQKASNAQYFKSQEFKRQCYSNNYLILAGSWWIDGHDKLRGLLFVFKSILSYPPNIFKILNKLRHYDFYQARTHIEVDRFEIERKGRHKFKLADFSFKPDHLVSVIIPCYNCEKYIAQAIESVLNQTYGNFELLIINDGSTDDSESVIRRYERTDSRIKYFFQSNSGVAMARNKGIKIASGDLLAFLDADDAWEPENLEIKVKALVADEDVHWVYSDMYLADAMLNKREVLESGSDREIFNSLLARQAGEMHAPSGIVLKRKYIITNHLEFDPRTTPSEDLDLCIRMAFHQMKGKRIPQPLWTYRILPNSLSRNLETIEAGNLLILNKASKAKYFKSFWFKQKCYSNTFLILAGSWWMNGKNKSRGSYFLLKSAIIYPPNILKILSKFKRTDSYLKRFKEVGSLEPVHAEFHGDLLNRPLPFKKPFKKTVIVFLFHRVNTMRDQLWNPIQPAHFEEIIAYCTKYFEPVPLNGYLLNNYVPVTSKPLCSIGFDDGYRDYQEYALPILKKYNCPSSMYLVTDCIDQDLPPWTYLLNHLFINTAKLSIDLRPDEFFGDLKHMVWKNKEERINYARMLNPFMKSLQNEQRRAIFDQIVTQFNDVEMPHNLMLRWNEIKELAQNGCEIGSHSVSHPVLSKNLTQDELRTELRNSGETIAKYTGKFPETISYPFGAFNAEVKKVAYDVGYKVGVTVNPKPFDSSRHDLFEVPRIELYDEPFFKTRLRINQIMPRIKQIISPVS